jgi:mannose-6-phosphate isomerase-like protein (cupin superfamily)
MQPSDLRKVSIDELLAPHPPRTNFNLFWVDGQYTIRVARVRGEFPWHTHDDHDEAWVVLHGRVRIRTEHEHVELKANEALLIPAGLKHSPLAIDDLSTVLIVNAKGFKTNYLDAISDADAGYSETDV